MSAEYDVRMSLRGLAKAKVVSVSEVSMDEINATIISAFQQCGLHKVQSYDTIDIVACVLRTALISGMNREIEKQFNGGE